jgi:hypothetical protein
VTKIFVSHASEDKTEFVRPLAEHLRQDFEVWYDEYSLNVGDSLREKIDEGLRATDYGVVVLSKYFFDKHWTQSELDGLFGLESKNRKIILPVWLNVTKDEVTNYSPMLAGRKAALASNGLERVVQDLKMAISASSRTQEVNNPDSTTVALNNMWQTVNGWKTDQKLLGTSRGVGLFEIAFEKIVNGAFNLVANSNPAGPQTFTKQFNGPPRAEIHGPDVSVTFDVPQFAANSVFHAKLETTFHRIDGTLHNRRSEVLETVSWAITCIGDNEVGFKNRPESIVMSATDVSKSVVEKFCHYIEVRVREKEAGRRLER